MERLEADWPAAVIPMRGVSQASPHLQVSEQDGLKTPETQILDFLSFFVSFLNEFSISTF